MSLKSQWPLQPLLVATTTRCKANVSHLLKRNKWKNEKKSLSFAVIYKMMLNGRPCIDTATD